MYKKILEISLTFTILVSFLVVLQGCAATGNTVPGGDGDTTSGDTTDGDGDGTTYVDFNPTGTAGTLSVISHNLYNVFKSPPNKLPEATATITVKKIDNINLDITFKYDLPNTLNTVDNDFKIKNSAFNHNGTDLTLNGESWLYGNFSIDNGAITDYLSAGVWIVADPDNLSTNFHFGSFVFTSYENQNEFPTEKDVKYQYDGDVFGFYTKTSASTQTFHDVKAFEADIDITADFKKNQITGTIKDYDEFNPPPGKGKRITELPVLTFDFIQGKDSPLYLGEDVKINLSSIKAKFYNKAGAPLTAPLAVGGDFYADTTSVKMVGAYTGRLVQSNQNN